MDDAVGSARMSVEAQADADNPPRPKRPRTLADPVTGTSGDTTTADTLINGLKTASVGKTVVSFSGLAPEVHERIFELLAEPPGGPLSEPLNGREKQDDPSVRLRSCVFVAHSLYDPAMRVLYRDIGIRDHFRLKYLRRSLTLNPSLGQRIRQISIDTFGTPRPHDDAWAPSSLYRLLDHCPSLRSLRVRGLDDIFAGKTSIRSAKCFGPQLNCLSMSPVSGPLSIHSLSSYFEGLHLTKVELGCYVSFKTSYFFDVNPPALESLVLMRASIDLRDLKLLLKRSFHSLRSLVLDLWPIVPRIGGLSVGANTATEPDLYLLLQSLPHDEMHTLEFYWREHEFRLLECVSNYPKLRRLGFGGPLSTTSILRHLPSTLEELVFERAPSITSDKLIEALLSETDDDRKGAVKALRQIEVGPGVDWTKDGWEQVRWHAQRRGVQIGHARTHAGQEPKIDYPPNRARGLA